MSSWALAGLTVALGGLIALNLWARRRLAQRAHALLPGVRLIGQSRLSPQHQLWLVQLEDGRRLLLGGGRAQLQTLAVLPAPSEAPHPTRAEGAAEISTPGGGHPQATAPRSAP